MATEAPHVVLFTNFGTLRHASAEEARPIHNATAGNPAGVAAAQALGDLSHLVYIPMGEWTGEIVFMDQWTSAEGIQQFFADPQVQAGAGQLFTAFDPVVWRPAEGFLNYTITTPQRHHDRMIGIIRGRVTSLETAQRAMNQVWSKRVNEARKLGLSGHEVYIRLAQPGTPESLEILGVDTWFKHDGIHQLYEDSSFMEAFDGVFSDEPKTLVLHRPAGDWAEW